MTLKQLWNKVLSDISSVRYWHDEEVLADVPIYQDRTAKPKDGNYREHSGPCRGPSSLKSHVPVGCCATCGNRMPRQHSCNEHRINDTGGPNDDPVVKCEICGKYLRK